MKRSSDTDERDMPNRRHGEPTNAGAEENAIDQILADSFPASDAPPWTLGVTHTPPNDRQTRGRKREKR